MKDILKMYQNVFNSNSEIIWQNYRPEHRIDEIADILEYGKVDRETVKLLVYEMISHFLSESNEDIKESLLNAISTAVTFQDVGREINWDTLVSNIHHIEESYLEYIFICLGASNQARYIPLLESYLSHSNRRIVEDAEDAIREIKFTLYEDTPAWELLLAVRDQKTDLIEKITKNESQLLNYQEPKYGGTLLLWAVGLEKYHSVETLLKCGADPNIASTIGGKTPLFLASGYSWVCRDARKDIDAQKDPKYVKLLLRYGANPNKNYIGGDEHDFIPEPGTSPLVESIGSGIEKTKALVEGGADINYKTPTGRTAAIIALDRGGPNATLADMEYAHYLIVEKKAKVSDPYFMREDLSGNIDPNKKFYPVNLLRTWVYDLNSEEHKIKMEIVEAFARQGVNYWDTKINSDTLNQIKKLYPDMWEGYIKKY